VRADGVDGEPKIISNANHGYTIRAQQAGRNGAAASHRQAIALS
jgi:hypothetical protein